MQREEAEFQENGHQLAVKWHDKRDVHVLSTVHTATMSATGKVEHLTGERKIKPDGVLDYNGGSGLGGHDKQLCGMHLENEKCFFFFFFRSPLPSMAT
jgi:hypothetical protein